MRRAPWTWVGTIFIVSLMTILSWSALAASGSSSSIEQFFQNAKRDYVQKDFHAAAVEIRKASSYLKAEEKDALAKGKEALEKASRELDRLADEVEKGTSASGKKMSAVFARAYQALASSSYLKSAEAWTRKDMTRSGENMEKSSRYLEQGIEWSGHKAQTGIKAVIDKAKEISRKLKDGTGWAADEVGKGLKDMGSEIEKFGKKISSK